MFTTTAKKETMKRRIFVIGMLTKDSYPDYMKNSYTSLRKI